MKTTTKTLARYTSPAFCYVVLQECICVDDGMDIWQGGLIDFIGFLTMDLRAYYSQTPQLKIGEDVDLSTLRVGLKGTGVVRCLHSKSTNVVLRIEGRGPIEYPVEDAVNDNRP